MNREELKEVLDKEKIDPHYYSLDGLAGGPYDNVMILEKEGSRWLVYYYERGEKWDIHVFETEDEACKLLLQRILRYPDTRIWEDPERSSQ